jgi:energy-coupling factor transporter ATP-binding protein EcfA2
MSISEQTTLNLTLRPKTFDEVIGLETAVKTIKAQIDSGGVPRAILIHGPYGCGKTTLAHIIARYIQGPLFDGIPVIEEVNGANYKKLDDMRELCKHAGSYPMQGTYSVIIMDECHQLTKDAKACLLKELEVPVSPTVWILATTDPEALNDGVRSRCFTLEVEGLDAVQRHELIARAAAEVKRTEPCDDFEIAVRNHRLVSPRKILTAFEIYHRGTPAAQACGMMLVAASPEHQAIGFATCFGSWDKPTVWKDRDTGEMKEVCKPLGQLLKELDERLKKKPAADSDTAEVEDTIEDDDLVSKEAVTHSLRACVGAFLKGQVLPTIQKGGTFKYKTPEQMERVRTAMQILANFIPTDLYELQWSGLMVTLYRVNMVMKGAK